MSHASVAHMKKCNRCSVEKTIADFPKTPHLKRGYSAICKICKVESSQLRKFGITTKDALSVTNVCQLCNKNLTGIRVCIDHDHVSGELRGILCSSCNTGLGHLGDSIEGLEKAIAYLRNPPMKP